MRERRFINREKELESLEKAYRSRDAALVVVYGRRRVGKTALIKRFIDNKKGLYFLATQEADSINRRTFQQQLAALLPQPYLSSVENLTWELMFEEIARAAGAERLIVVIDEFQYLGMVNAAFPSLLQKIWDNLLSDTNVMIVLCGSLISLMEDQVLHYGSPLYGRRTAQIRLGPLNYRHCAGFYPAWMPEEDLLFRYGITGGIPRNLETFAAATQSPGQSSFWEAVSSEILDKNALLYEEPYFLLSREVKELGSYFSVLAAIAAGNHKLGHIARVLQVKEMNMRHYLKTLGDLDVVQRLIPVTEENPEKSRQSLYIIKDEFLRFWFRFVYPYGSYLEMERKAEVLERIKRHYVEAHLSMVYETVCLQDLVLRASGELAAGQFNRFGKWWDRQDEIDLVALSEETETILCGECKLTRQPVDTDILKDLRRKAARVKWGSAQRKEIYIIYSMAGFTNQLRQVAAADPDLLLFNDLN